MPVRGLTAIAPQSAAARAGTASASISAAIAAMTGHGYVSFSQHGAIPTQLDGLIPQRCGSAQKAITEKWRTAAARTKAWKTSW